MEKIADVLGRDPGDLITKYSPEAVELMRLLNSLGPERLEIAVRIITGLIDPGDDRKLKHAAATARKFQRRK